MEWGLPVIAYFVGSIPWGLVIVRVFRGNDVREAGSGKIGVTNVLRTAGVKLAVIVLIADVGKGVIMVTLAKALANDPSIHAFVAAGVVLGHIWPIFAGFRGGRGIASGFGGSLALDPLSALPAILVFLPVTGLTRFVSLGSIAGVITIIGVFAIRAASNDMPLAYFAFALVIGGTIISMHKDNISRLVHGTERKIGR